MVVATLAGSAVGGEEQDDSVPFGAVTVIIELTDNDIELQIFVDGSGRWKNLEIFDPRERRIFDLRPKSRLRRQGMSELFFASNPSPFPEDDEIRGGELEGEAVLSHVLPALPKIVAPVSEGDEPPIVDVDALVIEWEPVTTRFIGEGSVEIIEYQVILDQVDPLRDEPWVDGKTRRALINLPGTVTRLTVPPEFLVSGASYEFEVLAIEASGNSTISVGDFISK
jgi:hypothetical protein